MRTTVRFFFLLAFLGSALGARAAAPAADLPLATAAAEQGSATAPLGWADFCRKNPSDCAVGDLHARVVTLTPQSWRAIVSINDRVNRAVAPVTDQEQWGLLESWDYPSEGKGDCEDYVLQKRQLLIAAGLPRQALLVTVVSDRKGEGHAVLTVKTDRGEFILDNQSLKVVAWTSSGYRFVKRQSQESPNRWVWLGWASGDTATAAR
jgi:predicted transglutaminase-like cysteine proteinase